MKQRHFLSLSEFSAFDLKLLLDTADEMKKHPRAFRKALKGKILLLLFEQPAPEVLVSFGSGIQRLGGLVQVLSAGDLGQDWDRRPARTAAVFSRCVDGMVLGAARHQTAVDLAMQGTVPVVNGDSDWEHPCRTLADLQTLRRAYGRLEGLRLTCIGGGAPAHGLLLGTARTGMDCTLLLPGDQECPPEILEQAEKEHARQGTRFQVARDLGAVHGSQVIYASTGPEGEGQETDPGSLVTPEVLDLAGPDAVFMDAVPIRRQGLRDEQMMEGRRSLVLDQAENRLWAQMAVIHHLLDHD